MWRSSRPLGKSRRETTLAEIGSPLNSTATVPAPRRTTAVSARVSGLRNQPRWTKTVCGQSRKFSRHGSTAAGKRVCMAKVVQPASAQCGKRNGSPRGSPAPIQSQTKPSCSRAGKLRTLTRGSFASGPSEGTARHSPAAS